MRKGCDLTCTAAGGMVIKALAAAERVAEQNVSVEVIDLRCVMPLDEQTIIASAFQRDGCSRLTRRRGEADWPPRC